MKHQLTRYLSTLHHVTFYFVSLREQESEIEIEKDTHDMYVKGTDTFLPGVLYKTIRSIEYIQQNSFEFDLLIRSNISTVIDMNANWTPFLEHMYGGCHSEVLQWVGSGVTESNKHKWFGTNYIQGICITMNKKGVEYLVKNKHLFDLSVIDDVAIGKLFEDVTKPYCTNQIIINGEPIQPKQHPNCYRNKSDNRLDDVDRMKRIIDYIR